MAFGIVSEGRVFGLPMDGNTLRRTGVRSALIVAGIAMLGATGAGNAQQQDPGNLAAPQSAVEAQALGAPVFVPSEEAIFEEAFARFEEPVVPEIPEHAVDITTIEPAEPDASSLGTGIASYYGRRFHGRRTANGESFDMHAMTAAHRTLPFGSRVRVTNPRNGKTVVVRINDRGPFTGGRTIDLSRAAAEQVGIVSAGHGRVELELLD